MDLKPSNITADTLEGIHTETSKDPALSILNSVKKTGWPDERKSVPEEIKGLSLLTKSGDALQDTQSSSRF